MLVGQTRIVIHCVQGVLPPGMGTLNEELTAKPTRESAGQDARLYGRRDARRYAKQIPGLCRPSTRRKEGAD